MDYKLKLKRINIPDNELLSDLKSVTQKIGCDSLTQEVYNQNGVFQSGVFKKRFKSWNNALKQADLPISRRMNIPNDELFNNIAKIWGKLGRQPRQSDFANITIYKKRFGTYNNALKLFIKWVNSDNKELKENAYNKHNSPATKHKTKRDVSDRLKVKVLMRDVKEGVIKCALCGEVLSGDQIHYDHKTPWSKGGETVLENIQILCAKHNLAKGDYLSK